MGEGSPKGGKGAPTEESGSGEVRHSGDGDTRGGDTAIKVGNVTSVTTFANFGPFFIRGSNDVAFLIVI